MDNLIELIFNIQSHHWICIQTESSNFVSDIAGNFSVDFKNNEQTVEKNKENGTGIDF